MAKLVRAIHGPSRGLISLEDADADAAIKAGWAVDPYATYDASTIDVEKAEKAATAYANRAMKSEAPKEAEKPAAKVEPKVEPKAEAKTEPKASASKE